MGTQETPASWVTYFGEEPFSAQDRRVKLIEKLCLFFLQSTGWEFVSQLQAHVHPALVLPINFADLCAASNLEDLQPAIDLQPHECLGCLGAAVYEVLFETDQYQQAVEKVLGNLPSPGKVTVRPYNVPGSLISIRSIQSNTIGAMLASLLHGLFKPVQVGRSPTCAAALVGRTFSAHHLPAC
jgi:hypothetical protein